MNVVMRRRRGVGPRAGLAARRQGQVGTRAGRHGTGRHGTGRSPDGRVRVLALVLAAGAGAAGLSSCASGPALGTHVPSKSSGARTAGATKKGSTHTTPTKRTATRTAPTTAPVTTMPATGAAGTGSTDATPVLDAAVLDAPASGTLGYGQVRPSAISISATGATNEVTDIAWTSWGGKSAVGTGTGCVLNATGIEANCTVTRATVVAYELGTCAGTPAYLEVDWYFPSLGQSFTPSTAPAVAPGSSCTTTTTGGGPSG